MITVFLRVIIGMLFALFIPGYLAVLVFFKDLKKLERLIFAVALSLMISVAIGLFFGYNEQRAQITGGLNLTNIFYGEIFVNLTLLVLLMLKKIIKKKKRLKIKNEIKKNKGQ